ncbi:hypothetical protein ACN20G_01650 [Streptomyces sp. BI20]|uniref:hypothetical protein n=1 Tax=Streptomyces sp. BI20 TaxID=3403460 RepID=UPI003C767D64
MPTLPPPPPPDRAAVLAGLGGYAPPRAVTNDELCGGRSLGDEWIRTRIGVESRFVADGEATVDLGVRAGRRALRAAGVDWVDAVAYGAGPAWGSTTLVWPAVRAYATAGPWDSPTWP